MFFCVVLVVNTFLQRLVVAEWAEVLEGEAELEVVHQGRGDAECKQREMTFSKQVRPQKKR